MFNFKVTIFKYAITKMTGPYVLAFLSGITYE